MKLPSLSKSLLLKPRTSLLQILKPLSFFFKDISSLDPEKLRSDLEHQLAEWSNMDRGTVEEQRVAQEAWRKYELLTSSLSQELCEQLRLVLEPSLATKLKYVICKGHCLFEQQFCLF